MAATRDGEPSATDARFEQLLSDVLALPMKRRIRLLDALRGASMVERQDGLRFHVESSGEYKRSRKQSGAQASLAEWIATFTASDVLYDIGANTGSISLQASQHHGGRLPIYAFEPAFDTFGALVRNIAANGAGDAITALPFALFDATGILPLHRSSLGAGTALHAVGDALDYTRQPFVPAAVERVPGFRLDDMVRVFGLPLPTRIKLDVDGFEHRVLAGAADALAAAHPDIYMEMTETEPDDAHVAGVSAWLETLGYSRAGVVEHRLAGVFPRVFDALFIWRGRRAEA